MNFSHSSLICFSIISQKPKFMLRKTFLTFIFAILSSTIFAQSARQDSTETSFNPVSLDFTDNLLSFAGDHLHLRYRSGGTSKKGFDCSGFVRYCFNHFGMLLPHGSAAQGTLGSEILKDATIPGDLIFFKGHNSRSKRIGHVGIVTEVTDNYIKFIHSAWNGGIRYDYLESDYYRKRFMGIKRVIGIMDATSKKTGSKKK